MAKKSILSLKYSAEEWEAYQPALSSMSQDTLSMARAVLVEGLAPSEIARKLGTSRQRVALAAKRVNERLDTKHAEKLVPLHVWVKPSQVEDIKRQVITNGGSIDD